MSRHTMNETARNPDQTRESILLAAFEEIYQQGFRKASIDNILRRTGMTKGALYHHFPNKMALGYAVVDEIIVPHGQSRWQRLQQEDLNPIDTLLEIGEESAFPIERDVSLGCPINNLAQEMSGLDEGFRQRLNGFLDRWRNVIENALRRGQRNGQVRTDIKPHEVAAFMVAAFEGAYGLAKCAGCQDVLDTCLDGLNSYVNSLRAAS
ncbi:MAG: TetR/AcrR family transcriptional regulator [Gammaproteobacteria bacterium]|nr:TetR/AcrR family transcriptional regulator [Gammaproteobacteria bacterium]NNM20637.1 TetR/AcrR family transcriptional regulator [Gammaproteobacteria bacterium]